MELTYSSGTRNSPDNTESVQLNNPRANRLDMSVSGDFTNQNKHLRTQFYLEEDDGFTILEDPIKVSIFYCVNGVKIELEAIHSLVTSYFIF